jgi:mycoredoxin
MEKNQNSETITMYGTPTCPMVGPVKRMLNRAQAKFDYVNIAADDAGRQHVQAINNGYESVPTLVFTDGSTLTEPSSTQLKTKLESLGYKVPPPKLHEYLLDNFLKLVLIGGAIAFGLAYPSPIVTIGGAVVLIGLLWGWLRQRK